MQKVVIKLSSIKINIGIVEKYLGDFGLSLRICTKCIKLNDNIIHGLDLKRFALFDTRKENSKLISENDIPLLTNNFDYNSNKISLFIDGLENITNLKDRKPQELYIFLDSGDEREGIGDNEMDNIVKLLDFLGINNVILMCNIGCFNRPHDIKQYYESILKKKSEIEKNHINVKRISLGGSYLLPYLSYFRDEIEKELRVGEAIFFGTIPGKECSNKLGLIKDNIYFEPKIIKTNKSKNLLCSFGYETLDQNDFRNPHIKILKQSSRHSLLRQCDSASENLRLPLDYKSFSKMFNNSEICMVTEKAP